MPRTIRRLLLPALVAVLLLIVILGVATAPAPQVDRTAALATRLRCPVCQGESVEDSPSDTARAIKAQIGEFVDAGWSDRQVLDFYVQRYGRWVLLDPPASGDTLVLWALPALVLAAAVLVALTRRRRRAPDAAALDPEDIAAVDAQLAAMIQREQS